MSGAKIECNGYRAEISDCNGLGWIINVYVIGVDGKVADQVSIDLLPEVVKSVTEWMMSM